MMGARGATRASPVTYLGFSRLHFSGRFQADPSTVNNEAINFDMSIADSAVAAAGGWNPEGTGAWRFVDCAVRSVGYRDGTTCEDPNVDPIVGMPVNDADDRVAGKIVDLDPQQQLVSEIWGFEVLLGRPP